jgi:predicted phage terminase large subunit-like protein
MGIGDTMKAILQISRRYPTAALKLLENKANGPAIEDLLKHEISGIVLWEPTGDKVARVNAVAPQFESGNVFFPARRPWVHDLVEELVTFPSSAHDDRTDALSMALLRMQENEVNEVGVMRVVRR